MTVRAIDEDPGGYVRRHGTVLAEFGHLTQESGNVSWLVDVGGTRLFVKTAGSTDAPVPGAPTPYFDHAGRVRLLRNAVELASSCAHPALPRLLNVIESPYGPALVYEAARGELVHVPRERRGDPASAYQRFGHLQADRLLGVFDVLVDLHVDLAAAGWVACDLYDGCLLVDFATASLSVVDLDTYRRGPSVNDMGRMFGASRFMAPEELELGAPIDERTTVFTLGRLVWHFGTGSPSRPSASADRPRSPRWCGGPADRRRRTGSPASPPSPGSGGPHVPSADDRPCPGPDQLWQPGGVSFDVFFQGFVAGGAAEGGSAEMLAVLGPHVTERDGTFLRVRVGDGEAYIYLSSDSMMANHVSGRDPWDALVEGARAANWVILPIGCPTCLTRPDQRDELPVELLDEVVLVSSGAELLTVIVTS
ncbi:MAG: hypothetical protein JWO76_2718 [Nocardioides sp.]|nr:hypothetical protein [Nocardioides sp.]